MSAGIVIASALGLVTAAGVRLVLRWLPEPEDEPDKIAYRDLGDLGFVVGVGLLASVAAAVAALTQPTSSLPVWWVLSTVGVLLAAIDFRTTWLPLRLTRLAWLMMALALAGVGLWAGPAVAVRGLLGAAVAGLLYFLVYRFPRGGFGFGDVRFAPLVGVATASGSWALLLWGLTLGSLAGGVQGVVRLIRGRRDGFAYAPVMLAGAYLACLLVRLTDAS